MKNNKKMKAVIIPIIFFLCFSFIGITAKAKDKVDNQYNVATINDQKDSDSSSSTKGNNDNINTNENKTTGTTSSDSSGGSSQTNVTLPSSTESNIKNGQDSAVGIKEEPVETFPEWKNIDGKIYYVTKDGILKRTGWFKEKEENHNVKSDNEYYLDKNYAVTIGWKEIEDSWYYFNESGIKQTGWKLINYNWYNLDDDGIMETGWIKDDGNKYYLNDEGIMSLGKKYIKDKWYFFGFDGSLQTGFYQFNGKTYYSTNDGTMVANEWIKTKSGSKYYVKADSTVATGNTIINNKMEEFNSNGRYTGSGEMEDHLFIKYLNVGDADCAFIKLPSGETALIDSGTVETSDKLVNFLKEQDLKKKGGKGVIDYVIITHAHSDHIGGLASVLDNFIVKKVYLPSIAVMEDWHSDVKVTTQNAANVQMMKTDYDVYNYAVKAMKDKDIKFTDTKKGEFIDRDKILQFVQSDKNFGPIGSEKITEYYWGINENSDIVYLNYGDLQALFTADMEWNSEKDFWVNDLLDGRDVDILKVPHHGSDTSSTPDFLKYLNPDIGIISRAKESIVENSAYNNLISNGVSLYETSAKDGISIYATKENWTVEN